MLTRRLMETAAMLVIGDSLLCLVSPQRHISVWEQGPRWWEKSADALIRHATLTRMLGFAGLGFGLWLAWRQEPSVGTRRHLGWGGRLKEALR